MRLRIQFAAALLKMAKGTQNQLLLTSLKLNVME
jgi:hypothetical protein